MARTAPARPGFNLALTTSISSSAPGLFLAALTVHLIMLPQVYSASLDGTVKLWDLTDGQVLKTVNVGAPVVSLVSACDSKTAAACPPAVASPLICSQRRLSHEACRRCPSQVVPSKGNVAFVTCDWREGTSGRVRLAVRRWRMAS